MMYERTQETIDRALARDAADRAGHGKPELVRTEQLVSGEAPARKFAVRFTYADGGVRTFGALGAGTTPTA